jgi:molecular chaperone GrpE
MSEGNGHGDGAAPDSMIGFDESWAGEGVEVTPGPPGAGEPEPLDIDSPVEFAIESDNELADEISGEIVQLVAERDQFKDIAQRLQADFENYRKRMTAQRAAEIDRATGALAEALLPVLDAAEAAYLTHPDEVGPLFNLLLAELKKQGLESIHLLDQPFDPNLADAVAHEAGDGGEPVVTEVLRSGYTWNGRTLRPAMVRTRD